MTEPSLPGDPKEQPEQQGVITPQGAARPETRDSADLPEFEDLLVGELARRLGTLVTTIAAYCVLLERQLLPDDPLFQCVREIKGSANHALDLIRQLADSCQVRGEWDVDVEDSQRTPRADEPTNPQDPKDAQ